MFAGKGPEMGLGALICGRCRLDLLRRVKARPTSMVICNKRREREVEEEVEDGGVGDDWNGNSARASHGG